MKQCKYCKKYYDEMDFGVAKTTPEKIYRRRKCRYCYRKTKTALWKKYARWLAEIKESMGCARCGFKDPRALDFHHLRDKEFHLAQAFYSRFGKKRMEKEIAKCEVVCANCHRILHCEGRKNGA